VSKRHCSNSFFYIYIYFFFYICGDPKMGYNIFIWLLLHKGVCTKEFLVYRYLLDLEEVLCPFYA
jgi:hypothetical protein